MGRHFLPVNLQPQLAVRMAFISCQEADPFQPVILQQVLQQRPEGQVFICIDTIKFFPQVPDRHHRALGPRAQLRMQLIPESFDLIRIRSHNNPVQVLDRGKGKHAPFLGVIIVLAGKVTDRCKNDHIKVTLLRFFLQRVVNRVVKKRIRFA